MSMLLLPAPVPMLRITHAYRERLKARERFAAANAVSREPPALLSFAVTRERAMFVATVYENFRDETGGHWTRVFIESCAFPSKSEANEWAARRVDAETINATAQRSKIPNGVQAYLTEDMEDKARRLESAIDVNAFMFAGKATLTLVSKKTGARFTYRVRSPKEDDDGRYRNSRPVWFVSLMTSPNNETNYAYLGLIREGDKGLTIGCKSRIGAASTALAARAFTWFVAMLLGQGRLSEDLEVWHEGRCAKCGRTLTVPESLIRGLGPECAGKTVVRPFVCQEAA